MAGVNQALKLDRSLVRSGFQFWETRAKPLHRRASHFVAVRPSTPAGHAANAFATNAFGRTRVVSFPFVSPCFSPSPSRTFLGFLTRATEEKVIPEVVETERGDETQTTDSAEPSGESSVQGIREPQASKVSSETQLDGEQNPKAKTAGNANPKSNNNNKKKQQQQPKAKKSDGKEEQGSSSSREDIRALRIKKVEDMRATGLNPFEYNFDRTHRSSELQRIYHHLSNGEEVTDRVKVSGRVIAKRVFGKLAFFTLRDEFETIQLYCDKSKMDQILVNNFENLKSSLDVGDIIGVEGTIKRTEKGELSVNVDRFSILTKSLLPLPDKWHGLVDVETRYRQRYVDMIANPNVGTVFRSRAKIISLIRHYMESLNFVEIETPVLQSSAGGAEAKPFITFHNSLNQKMFLRIATELHLKRMIVGGFDRVFEIGRIFRNEGISARHNPEFTSIELYQAYADVSDMMNLLEEIFTLCCSEVNNSLKIEYQGAEINFERPWRRISMNDLVAEETGIDFLSFSDDDIESARLAGERAIREKKESKSSPSLSHCPTVGHILNEIFEELVEAKLIQPTFVTEHPIEISPLAKPHRSKKGVVERFELFVYGREIANAFSELTDPLDQRLRFEEQMKSHEKKRTENKSSAVNLVDGEKKNDTGNTIEDDENDYDIVLDEDFLTALEYGMPPTAGMGIGIDRMVMLLTNSESIRDVIPFPILRNRT